MANPNLGYCPCPVCAPASNRAGVRKNKKGKLYLSCEVHGLIPLNTPDGQAWILDRMKFLDDPEEGGKADAVPDTLAAPEQEGEVSPTPKKRGALADIEDW